MEEWEAQLDRLKEQLSVRAIAKEISAARTPYTVKILSYRNGEGRLKPGQLVVGSSVLGVSYIYIYNTQCCFIEVELCRGGLEDPICVTGTYVCMNCHCMVRARLVQCLLLISSLGHIAKHDDI